MRCWCSLCLVIVVVLSGCGGTVDTGPAPAGGYNTTNVTYDKDPLENLPKTDVEVGEFVATDGAEPIRFEKAFTARTREVLTFRGQIRGQPLIARTHHVVVEFTQDSTYGTVSTATGIVTGQLQGDLVVYGVNVLSPRDPGRHRLTIKIFRALRDDGTMLPESEPDSTVIAEGEIDVRADDQKLTPIPDKLPPKR